MSGRYTIMCDEEGALKRGVRDGLLLRALLRWYGWRHRRCSYDGFPPVYGQLEL